MQSLIAICLAGCVLPMGPASISETPPPVVQWRIALFQVKDNDKPADASIQSTAASANHTSHSTDLDKLAALTSFAPPMKSTDKNWGPDGLLVYRRHGPLASLQATLVEDDDTIVLNGLPVRVRSWNAFEVAGAREVPLEKSKRVDFVFAPGLLTSADGCKADYCSTSSSVPHESDARLPDLARAWTWNSSGVGVSCDRADSEMVAVKNLWLGHWIAGNRAATEGIMGEKAYPIIAERFGEASFWLRPHQTAVIRLPRVEGDGGETVALVKAFLAGERNSKHFRQGAKATDKGKKSDPASLEAHRLPLPEMP